MVRRGVIPAERFYSPLLRKLRRASIHSLCTEQLLSGQSLDQLVERAGLQLPNHLNTRSKRWISFFLVAFAGAFAAGPIASWPTLQPLLIAEGVFAGPHQNERLAAVYSFANGFAMIAILGGGILYDALGPKIVAAGGAFGASASLIAMGVAIKVQSLNYLLWIAFPSASFFGFVNSMGCYAWLWLLPDEQSSVNACTGAIQALSDSFVLVAVLLNSCIGLRVPCYFFIAASLSSAAGIVSWMLTPSRWLNQKISALVLASQSGESYGAMESQSEVEVQDMSRWDVLSAAVSKLKCAAVCCTLHPLAFFLFISFQVFQYMQMAEFWFDMYEFYSALLGQAMAVQLVNIWGGLYAVMGATTLLLFGRFADWAGFVPSIAFAIIPTIAVSWLLYTPSLHAQIICQALVGLLSNTWFVFVPSFCMVYSPPELMGTMIGLIGTIIGICQMLLTPFTKLAVTSFLKNIKADVKIVRALPFLIISDIWCSLTVATSCALLLYWWHYPLPAQGSVTMADIQAATPSSMAPDVRRVSKLLMPFDAEEVFERQQSKRSDGSKPRDCKA